MWWEFGMESMDRFRTPPKTWRTTSLKNKMIRKIEDAIMYCSESLPENAGDMERRAFLRCETKRKYLRDIDRIIDYIDGITVASLIHKQQLERGGSEPSGSETASEASVNPQESFDNPQLRKPQDFRLKHALKIPDSRIRMGKILKIKSENYLRKIHRQGVRNPLTRTDTVTLRLRKLKRSTRRVPNASPITDLRETHCEVVQFQ